MINFLKFDKNLHKKTEQWIARFKFICSDIRN